MTFDAVFVPAELREAVADTAWLDAMLDAERALANAEAIAGVIPAPAAARIADACRSELYDAARLAEEGRRSGSPAEPLMRALVEAVGGEEAGFVHWGATSQDIVDSAAMLVARRTLELVVPLLDKVADECARHASEHRSTVMPARTLLQQAVPTTFGLKAAGWLLGVLEARAQLVTVRDGRLAAQLGGAAGTLAALGSAGPEVARLYAAELDLSEPLLPWHGDRTRIAELGSALALAAGVVGKIGLDVALLEQTEVAEVAEPPGAGGSSTMPQKRNPVGSAIAIACARRACGAAGLLLDGLIGEHERSLGAWQAEWGALTDALAYTGGAADAVGTVLAGLSVDAERMRANLEAAGGAALAERASFELARRVGRARAREIVGAASGRARLSGRTLFDELAADDAAATLTAAELAELADPAGYLGSAAVFVDRALGAYRDGPAKESDG